MIISIDFDGTIVENKFPKIGALMPHAKEAITALYNAGHKIIINTCRDGKELLDAINFLLHEKIPFHRVNDNLPENTEKYGSNPRKIYAHCYIDDRNAGGFPGWETCRDYIERAEKEYIATKNPPATIENQNTEQENILSVAHNVYIDVSDRKRGYLFKTINGYERYKREAAGFRIGVCSKCRKKRLLPPHIYRCAECFHFNFAPKPATVPSESSEGVSKPHRWQKPLFGILEKYAKCSVCGKPFASWSINFPREIPGACPACLSDHYHRKKNEPFGGP